MNEDLEAVIIAGGNAEDIEHVLLFNILREGEGNRFFPDQFHLEDDVENADCKFLFRFEKEDIIQLAQALRLPDFIRTYKGNKVTGITGLCMLLRRLSYPNRLRDLDIFQMSPQSMSLIINRMIEIIIYNHGPLLNNLQNLRWLNRERMEIYAQAVRNKGGAVPNCWGFIDGTARAICRPTMEQENYCSGHKRIHCVKYQSVLCPDGIIASLKGGWPGRRHDAAMFAESNLYAELQRVSVFPGNINYVLYGDQAYGVREWLLAPYPNRGNLEEHQRLFNTSMKNLRVAVEWGFQKVLAEFAFLDFRKNQKLLLQDVEAMYKVGVLLNNCHTCIYGSQTSTYFNVNSPLLHEYLGV